MSKHTTASNSADPFASSTGWTLNNPPCGFRINMVGTYMKNVHVAKKVCPVSDHVKDVMEAPLRSLDVVGGSSSAKVILEEKKNSRQCMILEEKKNSRQCMKSRILTGRTDLETFD
jgi:hypothetical protein